ncbi:MAG: fused MFS/spermidine synthase [Candidatus Aminicenantes bacterium]|nr:fused MFS/spermidine synthase [Candidatus Aminicenantes bacterium]
MNDRPASRYLPALLVLFLGSGCAALIYEIVWFQLLEMVVGSSAVSLAVLLGTYMGGMGAGSLLLPRLVSPRRNPLRVYAALEAGIGLCGLAILFGMPAVVRVYSSLAGHGFAGLLGRGVVGAACLLVPTLLMGATLPAISRWIEATPRGVSWLGLLYGVNTLGAVIGCLLAGFYLLRLYDMGVATYVAVAVNAVVASAALVLSLVARRQKKESGEAESSVLPAAAASEDRGTAAVLVAIGLSGFCALGAEVVWTRLLSLLLGGTVYTFSIILAVFLAGIGLGGGAGSLLARGKIPARSLLAACQLLLTAGIAWAAFSVSKALPLWPINATMAASPGPVFQIDLIRCLWAVFPAALLWGASFPLTLASVAGPGRDPGRSVAKVYAANTAGAILGAVGFSLIFIPTIGTQQSQRLMIGLAFAAALVAGVYRRKPLAAAATKRGLGISIPAWTAALLATALLLWSVPGVPWVIIAWGRTVASRTIKGTPLYVGEGMSSSVAVVKLDEQITNFHVSGKVEASSDPQDMRLQRMLGHIPALLHPKPESVLIVGCGAGVTAGSFVPYPSVKRIVICEIEPLIPKVVARFFAAQNHGVLDDPRVEVVIDDARHYILTTREKFDIITSDPIHPWVKGSASLYSKEYFELVRQRLNPGGLVTQWVPLYESTREAVQSEMATFFDVFPRGTIWGNDLQGLGYDVVLLGQAGELHIDLDALAGRLAAPAQAPVLASLEEVGFPSATALLGTFAGYGPDLALYLKGAAINRDRNLRLQYLAGLGLNAAKGMSLYDEIMADRRFPSGIITGSPGLLVELRGAMRLLN